MKSILVAIIVGFIALCFGVFAGMESVIFAGMSAFFLCVFLAMVINWIAFLPSAAAQSDRLYDTTGALTYFTVTLAALFMAFQAHGSWDARGLAVAAMVIIWCGRLGIFLFRRIHAEGGSDSRFDKIKTNPARFLVAWTLQGLWVTLTAAAALAIITAQTRVPLDIFFWIGAGVWVFGFALEAVADAQKSAFKQDSANKGRFINVGLWRWCRHPNYFGEITLWTGILIIAIPVLSGLTWLVVISPIFVTLLLTKVSGVNLQAKQAKERWGDDPEYQAYVARTPVLFPMPPRG